jgi:hypothetical protein
MLDINTQDTFMIHSSRFQNSYEGTQGGRPASSPLKKLAFNIAFIVGYLRPTKAFDLVAGVLSS